MVIVPMLMSLSMVLRRLTRALQRLSSSHAESLGWRVEGEEELKGWEVEKGGKVSTLAAFGS